MLSIEIASKSVKFIQGTNDKGRISIERAISLPLKEDVYHDGQIFDMDLLAQTIRSGVKDHHFSETNTVITVNSSSSIIREITLPSVKGNDLKEMIAYEIQQYLPIELSQYVIQSRVIGDLVEGGTKFSKILVAAMPKEVVEAHLSLLEMAGLHPFAMDLHANCLGKLLKGRKINSTSSFEEQTVVFVELNNRQVHLSLYENGFYQFDRLLNIGIDDIDNNISSISGKYIDDAIAIRKSLEDINYVVDDLEEKGRIVNAVRTTIDGWIEEINRIFKFYTSRKSLNTIDAVYIYGEGSEIQGLDVYLERSLGLKVEIVTEIEGIQVSSGKKKLDKDTIGSTMPEIQLYMNAIGALIRL